MPCAMAMGEAAGVAAILSLNDGCAPENVNIERLQTILRKNGAILD